MDKVSLIQTVSAHYDSLQSRYEQEHEQHWKMRTALMLLWKMNKDNGHADNTPEQVIISEALEPGWQEKHSNKHPYLCSQGCREYNPVCPYCLKKAHEDLRTQNRTEE